MRSFKLRIATSALCVIFLAMACANSRFSNRFSEAFGQLTTDGISIPLHNELEFDQSGGHLQGIQLYSRDGRDYVFLSGSSSKAAYMAHAELAETARVIGIDTFMLDPYRHAGGFQIHDRYLAVGIEDNRLRNASMVMIYDLDGFPGAWTEPLHVIERKGEFERVTAGAVGITEIHDHALVAVGNWDSRVIDFYVCPLPEFKQGRNRFRLVYSADMRRLSRAGWCDPHWRPYQNINLFVGARGAVYLTGFTRGEKGQHLADVFELLVPEAFFDPKLAGGDGREGMTIKKTHSKSFVPKGNACFRAGAGLCRLSDGQLALFSCPNRMGGHSVINVFADGPRLRLAGSGR